LVGKPRGHIQRGRPNGAKRFTCGSSPDHVGCRTRQTVTALLKPGSGRGAFFLVRGGHCVSWIVHNAICVSQIGYYDTQPHLRAMDDTQIPTVSPQTSRQRGRRPGQTGVSFPAWREIVRYGFDGRRLVCHETGFMKHKGICVPRTILKALAFLQLCSRAQETGNATPGEFQHSPGHSRAGCQRKPQGY